jgi:Tol biopolymer transport system component
LDFERDLVEAEWSSDSRWVISRTNTAESRLGDILAWEIGTEAPPVELVSSELTEVSPALSPDDRYLAYTSNESGVNQVYVVPFPDTDAWKVPVSTGRGIEPVWSRDGTELFYRRGASGEMVAVPVEYAGRFEIGQERVLFPAGEYRVNYQHPEYDVAPDGRFIMLRNTSAVSELEEVPMIQMLNFFSFLKQRLEAGG